MDNKFGYKYINVTSAFDIETTSTEINGQPAAGMYIWMGGIAGDVKTGRTWEEGKEYYDEVVREYNVSLANRLLVYVHNLGFEYYFLKDRLNIEDYFEVESHKPLKVLTKEGVEFRCSYLLSGMSLEKVGENLTSHETRKQVGSLDYSLIRHCNTELSEEEMKYCIDDVKVLMDYEEEQIALYGSIKKIPYTNTGRVRQYCRQNCLFTRNKKGKKVGNAKYHDLMMKLQMEDEEYQLAHYAFRGGDTHANPQIVRDTLYNVTGYDITSDYPACVCAYEYPMSRGVRVSDLEGKLTSEDIYRMMDRSLLIMNVCFKNIRSKIRYDHYISKSKCHEITNFKLDNGRVVSADYLSTTITSIDFTIIKDCYEGDAVGFYDVWKYCKGYLPTPFVQSVLDLYKNKVELKNVPGKEALYLVNKSMLNSTYGMMVQHVDDIPDYNDKRNRFTFYPGGVFVTAYARRRLWDAILACGEDLVYTDTDSCKFVNDHNEWFTNNTEEFRQLLYKAMDFHKIPHEAVEPKGQLLGAWHIEGRYERFKTLGAKRYLVQENGKYELTNAGIAKSAIACMGDDPFKVYKGDLVIPPEYSGKLCHTYTGECQGTIADYRGVMGSFHEYSGVHLRPVGYNMQADDDGIEGLCELSTRKNNDIQ